MEKIKKNRARERRRCSGRYIKEKQCREKVHLLSLPHCTVRRSSVSKAAIVRLSARSLAGGDSGAVNDSILPSAEPKLWKIKMNNKIQLKF